MLNNFHEDTEVFAAVVERNGFSNAAEYLRISPALVSRRIRAIEKQLGVILLVRSTRKFELTAEGALLYNYARKANHDKQAILLAIESLSAKPSGSLKISAPVNFGRQYVAPLLCDFMKIYPDIILDLRLSNTQTNIINDKFDVVIRGAGYLHHEYLVENNLIANKLFSSPIILCASPDFLERHKVIDTPDDLQDLYGLEFNPLDLDNLSGNILWKIKNDRQKTVVKLKKRFSCDDIDTTIKIACAGNGIARVAEINVEHELKTKALVRILPTIDFGQYNLFAVFPHRNLPQRTRKLVDFFEQRWCDKKYIL